MAVLQWEFSYAIHDGYTDDPFRYVLLIGLCLKRGFIATDKLTGKTFLCPENRT